MVTLVLRSALLSAVESVASSLMSTKSGSILISAGDNGAVTDADADADADADVSIGSSSDSDSYFCKKKRRREESIRLGVRKRKFWPLDWIQAEDAI